MSELLLDKKLGESDQGAVEQIVASARTLGVIRSLERDQRGRKSQVVRFLIEADLIRKIPLNGTDLSFANLFDANLPGANLSSSDLTGANLTGAVGLIYPELARAVSLVDATMPDGTKMTEEMWEEFEKRYGQ
jgi:hypothetical protein